MNIQLPKAFNLGDFLWFAILIIFCAGFCYYVTEDWVSVGYLLGACLIYSAWIHLFCQGKVLSFYNAYEIGPTGREEHRELYGFARELSSFLLLVSTGIQKIHAIIGPRCFATKTSPKFKTALIHNQIRYTKKNI